MKSHALILLKKNVMTMKKLYQLALIKLKCFNLPYAFPPFLAYPPILTSVFIMKKVR